MLEKYCREMKKNKKRILKNNIASNDTKKINKKDLNQNNTIKANTIITQKKNTTIDGNNKNILSEIKSKYIIKQMSEFLNQKTFLQLIKYNNQIQTKFDMSIKEYFQIEIEVIPVDKPEAINKEEITRNYFYKQDKVKKIKILLDYEIESLSSLFKYCKCIKSINIKKYNREDITDLTEMFSRCRSLEEVDLSKLKINDYTDIEYMFSECSAELKRKIQNQYKYIEEQAFDNRSYDYNENGIYAYL